MTPRAPMDRTAGRGARVAQALRRGRGLPGAGPGVSARRLLGRAEFRHPAGVGRDPLEGRRLSDRQDEPRGLSALVGVVPRPDAEPPCRHRLQPEPDADGSGRAGDRGARRARPGDRRGLPADPAVERDRRLSPAEPDRRDLQSGQCDHLERVLAGQSGRAGRLGARSLGQVPPRRRAGRRRLPRLDRHLRRRARHPDRRRGERLHPDPHACRRRSPSPARTWSSSGRRSRSPATATRAARPRSSTFSRLRTCSARRSRRSPS